MEYMIFDTASNALASYEDEREAQDALRGFVAGDPSAADELVLLAFAEDGHVVGEAVSVFQLPPPVTVEQSQYVIVQQSRGLGGVVRGGATKSYFAANGWKPKVFDGDVVAA